jgi:MFS family permease
MSRIRSVYYGWVLAWTLGPTQLISWGIVYYTFGVLLDPMQRELGWSKAELTGAFSLALLVNAISSIFVGRWLDTRGPRGIVVIASCAASILVLAWANVHTLSSYYFVWALIGVTMSALLYEPAFWTLTRWFSGQHSLDRSKAFTLLTFFGGLASTVFVPLASALNARFDWRQALTILAALLAITTILPHALLLRTPKYKSDFSEKSDLFKSNSYLRQPAFIYLAIALALSSVSWSAMSVHLISYEISRGLDPTFVAWAAGFVGVTQVIARLVVVPFSKTDSNVGIAAAMFVCQSLSILALLLLPTVIGLIVYVVFFGIGNGLVSPIRAALVADTFGIERFGRVNGAIAFSMAFSRAIGPVVVGAWATWQGYSPALWVLSMTTVISAWCIWKIGRLLRS